MKVRSTMLIFAVLLIGSVQTLGCENVPGTREEQAAVGGAIAGATLGIILADEDNRLLGALLGGAVGAGSGYLIGADTDWFQGDQSDSSTQARAAITEARRNPATPAQARRASTADINQDGFVTMDELVAMQRAGFTDEQILQRLRATGAVFDLDREQAQQLIDAGVSPNVVAELETINRDERQMILGRPRA